MTTKKPKKKYLPMEAGHPNKIEWKMQRFPGQWTKMVFHPRPGRPTEPNRKARLEFAERTGDVSVRPYPS